MEHLGKTISNIIFESQSGIRFRRIDSSKALQEIYDHDEIWDFLWEFVDSSEEVDLDDEGNVVYLKSEKDSMFANDRDNFWIGGYKGSNLCFLQLMKKHSSDHLELVIAQKKPTTKTENVFSQLVSYIEREFPSAKYLSTYPMNKKLEDHYKSYGFYDWKGELRYDLRSAE